MRKAQKRLQNAPADVKDLEGSLPKVDRIAEIIQAGAPSGRKYHFLATQEIVSMDDSRE